MKNADRETLWIRPPLGELVRFVMVGATGFCIDGGILLVLTKLAEWPAFHARFIGFPLAVTATWWLNRVWTFRGGRALSVRHQYVRYFVIQVFGLLINLVSFLVLIASNAWLEANAIVALAIGAAASMGLTFSASRALAFKSAERSHG